MMPPVEQAATVYHNSAGALFSSWEKNRLQVIQQEAVDALVADYLRRFSEIAGPLINCAPILNWFELDARGGRLPPGGDESDINTPAVAAALVGKRYAAQASDEISLEVGDMISVIDMAPPEESAWWRGKRGFEVGFFPCECVQLIGDAADGQQGQQNGQQGQQQGQHQQQDRLRRAATLQPGQQPLLRRQGKLTAFFRSFIATRPSRRRLKQSGILRERVFGCDLGEHLMNTGRDIPVVLKSCAEFIETHGIVDGIYRLSGVTSNIQRLRNTFDEDRIPDLSQPSVRQDIHSVSGLLKQYLRELPNPLLTYQLYDKFVAAVQSAEEQRLVRVRDVVQQLPPPHYRTLEYLIRHLSRVATHHRNTGMTAKNLAIVWAPNLVRNQELELGGVAALQGIGVQAVIVEYLIRSCELVFSDKLPSFAAESSTQPRACKRARPRSLAIPSPSRLLSLGEAQARLGSPSKGEQNYIEVGGGPNALPSKYHTIITPPTKKSGSLRLGRSPIAWKSLFRSRSRQSRADRDISLANRTLTESDLRDGRIRSHSLRSARSFESLVPSKVGQRSTLTLNSSAVGGAVASASGHRPLSRLDSYFDSPGSDSFGISRTLPRNIRAEPIIRPSLPRATSSAAAAVRKPSAGTKLEADEKEKGPDDRRGPSEQPTALGEEKTPREQPGSLDHAATAETASASGATSRDVPQIPTDSTAPVAPAGAETMSLQSETTTASPSETFSSTPDSDLTTRGSESGAVAPPTRTPESHCTPADEDATGKDLSELVDEEATLDRLRSPVPDALELLDRRLNPADAYENIEDDRRPSKSPVLDQEYQNVDTEAAPAAPVAVAAAAGAVGGEAASAKDEADEPDTGAYEPVVFSGSSSSEADKTTKTTDKTSEKCETETFENEAYEHRVFDSQTYENETFAHVDDLPYENIADAESEQDDRWVYEDVTPAPTAEEAEDAGHYEPVCVAQDAVYEQVKEFRRTLKEVNSIVSVGSGEGAAPTVNGVHESGEKEVDQESDGSESAEMKRSVTSADKEDMGAEGREEAESQETSEGEYECLFVSEGPQPSLVRAATAPVGAAHQMALSSLGEEEIGDSTSPGAEDSDGDVSPVSVEPSTSVAVEVAASVAETEPLTRPPNPEPLTPAPSVERVSEGSPEPEQAVEPSEEAVSDDEDGECASSAGDVESDQESEEEADVDGVDGDEVDEAVAQQEDADDVFESEPPKTAEVVDTAAGRKISEIRRPVQSLGTVESPKNIEATPTTSATASIPVRSVREWRRPPVARSQTLPASVSVVEQTLVTPTPPSHSGNTWPARRPVDFTTAAVARILPLDPPSDPRAMLAKSSPAERLESSDPSSSSSTLSCKSATSSAGQRTASVDGSALPPSGGSAGSSSTSRRASELAASSSDIRRPSLRRASVRQLLSRFEASSSGDLAVRDDPSESGSALTERDVGSVHGTDVSGSYALATRSLPRPATRRRAGSPDRKRSLPATEARPSSPRPVRRHLSFQTVAAPEVRVAGVSGSSFCRSSRKEEIADGAAVGGEEVKEEVRSENRSEIIDAKRRLSQRSTASCVVTSSSEAERPKRPEALRPELSGPSKGTSPTAGESNEHANSVEANESLTPSTPLPATTPDGSAVSDATARQRIERYKEERRMLLRERFTAEAFLRRSSEPMRDRARSSGRSPSPPGTSEDVTPIRPLRRADSLRSPLSSASTTAVSVAADGGHSPSSVATSASTIATVAVSTNGSATATVVDGVTKTTAVAAAVLGSKPSTTPTTTAAPRAPTRRTESLRTVLCIPSLASAAPTAGPQRPAVEETSVRERVAGWTRGPTSEPLPATSTSTSTATATATALGQRPAAVTRQKSAPEVSKVRQAPEVGKIRHMAARFESGAGGGHRSSPVPTL